MNERNPGDLSVEELTSGSPEVLRELYHRFADDVYRVGLRLTGSPQDAEDVLQDVFVGLPEALRRYQERGKLGPWIRRVAARVALTRLRRTKRRGEVPIENIAVASSAGERPDVAVDRTALERALRKLPEKLRVVLVLKEVEGYSHQEIADLLEIRAGTSQVRLHRAHALLRRHLGHS